MQMCSPLRKKLPDFPWDALAPYGVKARAHPGGIIDLSQGTPVDPTPDFIQKVLAESANSPGYPTTAGTPELQEAIRTWAHSHIGITGEFDVLPLIGSKELVAWLPTFLQSHTVLYPRVAYPTYLVGAMLAQAKEIAVDIDATTWPDADLAWINSPANPSGRVHSESELRAVIDWAREKQAVVISDECYLEFGDGLTPTSIFAHTDGDNRNILGVFSLSKRSSLAGYRAAFMIGDPALIASIREIRKHAGMMVALPVQKAMTVALGEDEHVRIARDRYNARRATLRPALIAAGFRIDESVAGLYLWCTRGEDAWASVDWLAGLGILATPGTFYGSDGGEHIRIAMTATDAAIADAAARIMDAIKA
jgi:succinyldiaminopimelate transaminase